MSLSNLAQKYAPTLVDIAKQFEERDIDAVIAGCGAGPQSVKDPDQRQRLYVLVDNPWGEEQWVTVYSRAHCEYQSHGETYRLSLPAFLTYLTQLPRPLHFFSKYQP
jgi:hypothetical protein